MGLFLKKPYKRAIIVECEICKAITMVKGEKYRIFNDKGEVRWVNLNNWYITTDCLGLTWDITPETVLCPKCQKTIKIAKELNRKTDTELTNELKKMGV